MRKFSVGYSSGVAGKKMWLVYLLIFVVAFAFIGGGLWNLISKQSKIDGYVKTQAIVKDYKVSVERKHDENGFYTEVTTYAEIVTYTVDGMAYRDTNSVSSSSPKSIGSSMEIVYNPQDPSQCIFVKSTYLTSILLFVMGGVCSLIGVVIFVLDIKQKRREG